ncbi:MAG: peptide-methionine (S)-S-oxide reductase MsrA [Geminicoccaceae bacterium]|jgi:peptide-methionine (S)-S-oxide reductase
MTGLDIAGRRTITVAALLALAACSQSVPAEEQSTNVSAAGGAVAIFAGGCFWCMEPPFDKLDGVIDTTSGYTGGTTVDPTYKEVTAGGTGHTEAVQVTYDPSEVTYQKLLDVFWRNVDPLDADGQFCDRGDSYRTGIFVDSEEQRQLAEQSKQALSKSERFDEPIVSEIVEAGPFYPAEDYHQDYADKNPLRYLLYRTGCGRDKRLVELWGEEAGGGKH